jgi:isopentenyldiphosphate isomerase
VEEKRDILSASAIVHDLRKQGYTRTGHTKKNHPQYAAELVDEVQNATMLLTDEEYSIIRNCVGFHYGPWSVSPWIKKIEDYTMEELVVYGPWSVSPWIKKIEDYTMEELVVYIADYVAAKRCVNVDYKR